MTLNWCFDLLFDFITSSDIAYLLAMKISLLKYFIRLFYVLYNILILLQLK